MVEAPGIVSIPVRKNFTRQRNSRAAGISLYDIIFFYTVIEKRSMYKPATEGKGKSRKLWLVRKQWKVSL
jgi:hypothetical protein